VINHVADKFDSMQCRQGQDKVVKVIMSVKPVNINADASNKPRQAAPKKGVSFGNINPIVTVMEGVDRGGYIAAFLVQDGCGFVAPRISTGLNRNREETGKYNWQFAATEAIRELLSGPCMAIIPAVMLYATKKHFGSANDVHIKFIKAMGDDFAQFASKQSSLMDKDAVKHAYYHESMKNILNNATGGKLKPEELEQKAKYYTDKIFEIENAPKKSGMRKFLGKKDPGKNYDMLCDLNDEFVTLKKQHNGVDGNPLSVDFSSVDEKGVKANTSTRFKSFVTDLKNFTEDATATVSTKFKGAPKEVGEFLNKFKHNRVASRFMLILGMDLAVAAFLSIVPKLYKIFNKGGKNPGLVGLEGADTAEDTSKKEKEGV